MMSCSESEGEGGAGPARRALSVTPAGRCLLSADATSLSISTSDLSGGGRSARAAPSLCPQHRPPRICRRPSCESLHICRLFVDGFCPTGDAFCRWGHTMASDNNRAALAAHQLQALPEHDLLWLVRALLRQTAPVAAEEYHSQLVICAEYADDARCRRSDCFGVHLCPRLVAGLCRDGDGCRWSHRLTDPDNVMVLLRLRCAQLSETQVMELLARSMDDDNHSVDDDAFRTDDPGSNRASGEQRPVGSYDDQGAVGNGPEPTVSSTSGLHQTSSNAAGNGSSQNPRKLTVDVNLQRSADNHDDRGAVENGTEPIISSTSGAQQATPRATGNGSIEDSRKLALDMNLCRHNIHPSHCAGDCGQLHLCRLFAAGMCPYAKKCLSGHNLCSPHNEGLLNDHGLKRLTKEALLDAIKAGYLARNPITDLEKRLALQICRAYLNGPHGCNDDSCCRLHICDSYVAGTCTNGSRCELSHQLSTSANTATIKRVGLIRLPHKELIEVLRSPPAAQDVWEGLFSIDNSVASSSDSSLAVGSSKVSEGASASHQAAPQVSGNGPPKDPRELVLDVNLCRYNIHPSRCAGDCGQLHLCRLFVAGMCPYAKKCRSGHGLLSSPHNLSVLKQRGLEKLTEEEVLDAIKAGYLTRIPITDLERRLAVQICTLYLDDDDGCENDNCLRLHVCDGYVAGTCANGSGCGRSHQLLTSTNADIIRRAGLKYSLHRELLELLRDRPSVMDVWKGIAAVGEPVVSSDNSIRSVTLGGPTLCAVHASGGQCQRVDCGNFHICGFYLANLCHRPDGSCPLGHSFHDDHNRRVLQLHALQGALPEQFQRLIDQMTLQAHITFANGAEKGVRMCIPYNSKGGCKGNCCRFHVCHRYLAGTCSANECSLLHTFDGSHNRLVQETLGLVAATGCNGGDVGVTERELTELLRAQLGVGPGVYEEPPRWVRPAAGSGASPLPPVCGSLIGGRRCSDADCGAVHVCPHFLAGACRRQHCALGHRLDTEPNRRALRLAGRAVTDHNHDILVQELYAASTNVQRSGIYEKLRICIPHNHQGGCAAQNCAKIHICQKFVAGSCKDGNCHLGHVMGTLRNGKKLRNLGLENVEVDKVLEMLRAVHGVWSANEH